MLGIFPSKVSPRGKQSLQEWILMAWLCVWTQRTAGQGPGAQVVTAAEGQTAALTAPVTTDILVFSWYRGTGTNQSQLIMGLVVSQSKQTNGPLYTGRESVTPDGTLHIRDLRMNDTGSYTVSVTRMNTSVTTASRQLSIYEIVSIPVIQAVTQDPVENGPLVLVCNASGTDVAYQWYQDDKLIISGGRINITSNSQTLTLSPCTRTDSGTNFTCGASNAVSLSTSSQYTLTVSCSPCPTAGSCWQTTLGVACGILLGAAIIVVGMAVHYERRLKQMGTNKDENMYQNPSVLKNADIPYENVKKGQKDQSANPGSAADSAYMELKHGDRATYEQIKRP